MFMNILFIGSSLDVSNGGVDRVTYILSCFFQKNGLRCYYVFLPKAIDKVEGGKGLSIPYNMDSKFWKNDLERFVKVNKIEIIINQAQWSPFLIGEFDTLKKTYNCKIISCFHVSPDANDYFRTFKGTLLNSVYKFLHGYDRSAYYCREAVKYSDVFVLLSKSFIPSFIKRFKVEKYKEKLIAIPNPLSFQDNYSYEFCKKKKQVLIVSRLEEKQKNINSALRIWKIIEQNVTDWNLVIAGHGPSESINRDYANQLRLRRVNFIGRVQDPRELYKESSIFMMTSRFEGFGMVLTESQQFGCVPFAFDNFSVVHDIVDNERNGIIIPSNDEMLYANKMLSLICSPSDLSVLAENAVNDCKKFSVDNVGQQWLSLLNSVSL